MEEKIIYKQVINVFGEAIQKVVAMEECSELVQAISKSLRGEDHNVEEEIADVEIMIGQLKLMYDEKKVKEIKKEKLKRIQKMVI